MKIANSLEAISPISKIHNNLIEFRERASFNTFTSFSFGCNYYSFSQMAETDCANELFSLYFLFVSFEHGKKQIEKPNYYIEIVFFFGAIALNR